MTPLTLTSSLSLSTPFLPHNFSPISLLNQKLKKKIKLVDIRRKEICRAELKNDAPFAIAIGASMLNSLLFPVINGADLSEDEDSAMNSTDARFSVMTIISLIPYFNWLSWVFAAMDTGKRRYAVYALVYLAPYFRTNLSLSPEDSWLPIASIVLCVVHIQLEASIYSGDLDGFNFFNEVSKRLGLYKKRSHTEHLEELDVEELSQGMKLPRGKKSSNEIRKWRVSGKHSQDPEHVDQDDEKQH